VLSQDLAAMARRRSAYATRSSVRSYIHPRLREVWIRVWIVLRLGGIKVCFCALYIGIFVLLLPGNQLPSTEGGLRR